MRRYLWRIFDLYGQFDLYGSPGYKTKRPDRPGDVRREGEGGWDHDQEYHEDAHIGEYEWSSDQHMNAKIEEAEGATDLLLEAHRHHGCKIAVWWNSSVARPLGEEIRTYQENQADPGRGGTVLGVIPPEF